MSVCDLEQPAVMPTATQEDVRRARRVLFHGVTGSGKSTAALALGARLDLPVHLVDDEFGWLPGWTPRPKAEARGLAAAVAAQPEWVFDSAYSSFIDLVHPTSEVVIGLDYPRLVSLSRLLRRTLVRVVRRGPVCNGNVETLARTLDRDSIFVWHFRSFARKRRRLCAWRDAPSGPPVLALRHPRELSQLMRALG